MIEDAPTAVDPRSLGSATEIAQFVLIAIVMVVLLLTVANPAIRWVNIAAAIGLVIFNIFGLPYRFLFGNFLIIFGIAFNGLIVWYAWTWTV